ncbi:hypothetical protein EDB80DRAFT_389305 [Ilyonectria destructans]|nr:hypothetical protein EDB80DRAFT_389305 [Ilyonectria destructans]
MYSVLYNVLCHVPPHTDYPGHRRQGAPCPPSPQVRSPKTWVLSCKCNCVVVPETSIGIAHCILVHSHSGHRPSGCSLCSLLSVLLGFHLCTLAYHRLGTSSPWLVAWASRDAPVQASTRASRAKVRQMLRPGPSSLLVHSPPPPLLPVACTRHTHACEIDLSSYSTTSRTHVPSPRDSLRQAHGPCTPGHSRSLMMPLWTWPQDVMICSFQFQVHAAHAALAHIGTSLLHLPSASLAMCALEPHLSALPLGPHPRSTPPPLLHHCSSSSANIY